MIAFPETWTGRSLIPVGGELADEITQFHSRLVQNAPSLPGISDMTPLRKGLVLLFGMPVLLTVIFVTYFNATGEDRMKSVCKQVTPGMTQAKLKSFVDEWKLSGNVPESGTAQFGEPKSYGRHTCRVTLTAGVVTVAEYHFAD